MGGAKSDASGCTDCEWVTVGMLDDLPRQGARVVVTAQGDVAVFRTVDDQVFALLDRCPHRGGPLSQGLVCARRVVCPLHNWAVALESGEAVAPDQGQTTTYAVRVEDGVVAVALPRGEDA